MKYQFTLLFGIIFGVVMNILWRQVFSCILGISGIGVGIVLAVAFACCGCLFGYAIDKKHNNKKE